MTISRRGVLQAAGAGAVLAGSGYAIPKALADALKLPGGLSEGTRAEAVLDALPGKKPLIKLAYRPPNYETPVALIGDGITPNDAFFVRYHLADIPEVDAKTWRLKIGGEGANGSAELTLDDLKRMPAAEIVAVCQCSGNRRGLFSPHVPGVQWGYGAMGCARWRGARLKDVIAKVGLKKEAVEIVLDGADGAIVPKTPDFVKSIPVAKAIDENALVAYEMNGAPLPHFNGFPARIIIPGWTATYWVKHVTSINAVTTPFGGFWMKSAYRIPLDKFPTEVFATQSSDVNTPITEMVVNSLITSHTDGAPVKAGTAVTLSGLAWDAGYGIAKVEASSDGGASWREANLGRDLGRFAFRAFDFTTPTLAAGAHKVSVRATNKKGQTQVTELVFNPAGYHHNVVQTLTLNAA
ncbi:MAG TPA: molybdopterin-dependent oxidoreductase [Xanthobacteraceae bacterium]|nr:molybdopterin-dependent oxidoreductase [Xanthobacteraceae bacterium]